MAKSAPPKRRHSIEYRPREYLLPDEVKSMVSAARSTGRHPLRDSLMITLMFRHALRVSELINLTWNQIDLKSGVLFVVRSKNGRNTPHEMQPDEVKALKKLQQSYEYVLGDDGKPDQFERVFQSEVGDAVSLRLVHHIVQRAGKLAKLGIPVHPHMLRHARGYLLVNKNANLRAIQMYLGHRRLENTARYTDCNLDLMKGFGKDK